MAETIKIAELDLDIEALKTKATEAKKSIVAMSQEISQLKAIQKNAQENISDYSARLEQLTNAGKENSKEAQVLRNSIERNKETLNQSTRSLIEQEAELKKIQGEYRLYNTAIAAHTDSNLKNQQAMKWNNGTLNELSSAISYNTALYKTMTQSQLQTSKEGKELVKTLEEQKQKYKELHAQIGNTQVNVGNYREEVKKALEEHFNYDNAVKSVSNSFGAFGDVVVASVNALKQFVVGQKTATASTSAMSVALKVLRGAFVATGIGAVVVLLGSLIAYLTSTQEGVNKLSSVLTPLRVVFNTLWGVIQNVGKAIFDAFSKTSILKDFGEVIKNVILFPVNQVIASVKALGKVLDGNLKGAWEDVTKPVKDMASSVNNAYNSSVEAGKQIKETFGNVSDTMKEAWERGKRIAEINQQLSKSEADFIKDTAKLKEQFREQNQIAEDTTKTFKEREENAKKSMETLKQINDLERERNKLEVERLELEFKSNDTSDADKAELARKIAELNEANAERLKKETTQQNKLNTIRKQASDQWRQQLQKNLEEEKKLIDNYVNSNSATAKSLQERLALEEKAKNHRLIILEKEKEKKLITETQYNEQRQQIEADYLSQRAELATNSLNQEIALYEAQNQSKLTNEKRLTTELVTEEQARQEAIYQKKLEALEKEKELKIQANEWSYEQENEFQIQRIDLDNSYKEQQSNLNKTWQEQQQTEKKELEDIAFAQKLLQMEEENATQWDLQLEQLNYKYAQEQALLDEAYAQGKISTEKYLAQKTYNEKKQAKDSEKITKAKTEAELALTSQLFSQLRGLAGEHTALGKASAVAEATINTYLGATKAIAEYPMPFGGIMAGITIATGLANVAKIVSVQPPSSENSKKYAKGGLVKGRSHEQGGVPFSVAGEGGYEMEGGEYIINKRATALFFPQLEALNKIGQNGNSYPSGFFAGGGLVQRSIVSTIKDIHIDMEAMKQAIREGAELGAQAGASAGTYAGALQGTQSGTMQGIREQEMNIFTKSQSVL